VLDRPPVEASRCSKSRKPLARLLQAAAPLPPTIVPLHEALGLTLAERVVADRDVPPTDRSAMDGFAVRAADCSAPGCTLGVIGELRAGGDPASIVVGAGEAARVYTGSVIPRGADTVVMVEHTREDRAGRTVLVNAAPEPGQHVRARGEDLRAGDGWSSRGRSCVPWRLRRWRPSVARG
jgi:molybdopterin molybdotransferase